MKLTILKWYLRILALVQFALWGLTHIFFPAWYIEVMAGGDPKQLETTINLLGMNEIGVSVIALSIAIWIAAAKPVRHYLIILMSYIIGIGSMSVTLYHILVRKASQEWEHIIIVAVMLIILSILYPWKELKQDLSGKK